MDTKVCSKCGVEKALCEFNRQKDGKYGRHSRCKMCVKAYREANREKAITYSRKYYQENKDLLYEKKKAHNEANKEAIKERSNAYYEANKETIKERNSSYYQKNKERLKVKARLHRQQPEVKRQDNLRRRNKRLNDPNYRLALNVSNAVRKAIKKQGTTKGGSTFSALPYTPLDLVEHLEKQFDEKMTWDNYGSYWDVDHIYPQSLLPYDSLEHPNFQKCWALDNLQPLEKNANIRKSNKILDSL
jgi:hypothetical protein